MLLLDSSKFSNLFDSFMKFGNLVMLQETNFKD